MVCEEGLPASGLDGNAGQRAANGDAGAGGALAVLADDDGMPVLTAAINLCAEQTRPTRDGERPASAAVRSGPATDGIPAVLRTGWAPGAAPPLEPGPAGDALPTLSDDEWDDAPLDELPDDAAPGAADAPGAAPGACCDDPFDCEEPAVREAALHLLARLAARLAAHSPEEEEEKREEEEEEEEEEEYHDGILVARRLFTLRTALNHDAYDRS